MSATTTPVQPTERSSEDSTGRTRKSAATAFLRSAAAGHARDAFAKHAAAEFRHHNPHFPADADSLAAGMDDNAAQFPGKVLTVRHVLEDGDYVAVHSSVHMQPGDPGIAVVHLFRFEGDKVAELWDVAQQIPADSPNDDGAF